MQQVKGTNGYSNVVEKFVKVTEEVPFEIVHKDFLKFLPKGKSLILDLGAGTGRDAYELCLKGHLVLVVEPLAEFRIAGKGLYKSDNLKWIDDSLPKLKTLSEYDNEIDFALCSGVWHHLNEIEQVEGLKRVAQLLKPNGLFALSLRNGPAGAGTHIFPTNLQETIMQAKKLNLETLFKIDNQPSLLEHKEKVKWSRLVLQKQNESNEV